MAVWSVCAVMENPFSGREGDYADLFPEYWEEELSRRVQDPLKGGYVPIDEVPDCGEAWDEVSGIVEDPHLDLDLGDYEVILDRSYFDLFRMRCDAAPLDFSAVEAYSPQQQGAARLGMRRAAQQKGKNPYK